MSCARSRNCSGREVEAGHEVRDQLLAAEVGEHRREGVGADEEPAHHRGRPHGEVHALAQPSEGHRTIGDREHDAAERADGGGLGRRREAEEDRAQHGEDQDREREERGREHHRELAPRHVGHLVARRAGSHRGLQDGAADDVDEVEPDEREARQQRRLVEPHDGDARRRGVDDEHDRRRDQDAERAAGADDPRREGMVVARLHHRGECEEAHQRDHGADDAGGGREEGAGHERRDPHRARDVLRRDVERGEEPADDVRALDDVAHEEEERHRGQRVVRHHRVGLVDEEVEDAVVEEPVDPVRRAVPPRGVLGQSVEGAPHPVGVEVREVAEADAERHQREGDGEARERRTR